MNESVSERRGENVVRQIESNLKYTGRFANTVVIFLHSDDLLPGKLEKLQPDEHAKVEKIVREMADSDSKWSRFVPSTTFVLHPEDFKSAEIADFDPELVRQAEDALDMSNSDNALSKELSSSEWEQWDRRIRERIKARMENHIEDADPDWLLGDAVAPEAYSSSDLMGSIGKYFAQAGDYLRLGILAQKRHR